MPSQSWICTVEAVAQSSSVPVLTAHAACMIAQTERKSDMYLVMLLVARLVHALLFLLDECTQFPYPSLAACVGVHLSILRECERVVQNYPDAYISTLKYKCAWSFGPSKNRAASVCLKMMD